MKTKDLEDGQTCEIGSYDDLHPGRFLKCGMLMGSEMTLTIKAYYAENMGLKVVEGQRKKDIRGILEFVEIPEHYATQKTNESLLKAMFGSDPKAVVGKRVTLAPSRDTFGREEVDAIRICGSPDLDRSIKVTVKYAAKTHRKPKEFVLRKTSAASAASAAEAQKEARDDTEMTLIALRGCMTLQTLESVAEDLRAFSWTRRASGEIRDCLIEMREKLK